MRLILGTTTFGLTTDLFIPVFVESDEVADVNKQTNKQTNLFIPVFIESDQVADVAVAHVCLLGQHSGHKDVVHPEDPVVTALIHL